MKSKVKKLDGTAVQFDIELSKDTVDKVFDQVYEEIRKTADMPGFRKGKVPMDMIRKAYSEDARDEVKRRLIPDAYQQVLEENKVEPVSYPEVSDVKINVAGQLCFTTRVDTHPDVVLKKYKGIKVSRDRVEVSDKEIDEALSSIRNMHAEFPEIDRPLEKGDFAICDVETFMDGEPISKKRENMWVEVSKEASMLGMGEELEGLKKGDRKDIGSTLPGSYPDKKFAGKEVVFKVEIKDTREKKVPELDGSFAKKMGKEKVEEVTAEIGQQLAQRKEANEKIKMENQIMEYLLGKSTFHIPASMVKRQLKVLVEKAENDLMSKGVAKDVIDKNREQMEKRLVKEAENKVRLYFILDAIADAEGVEVTEGDVEEWFKSLAASYGQSVEEVKKYYGEHDLLGGVREQLREDKTLQLLLDEAVVTEKK